MFETSRFIPEYGDFKPGDRVRHKKLLTLGTLKSLEVIDEEFVMMWVLWDAVPDFEINMKWEQIMRVGP